MKLSLLLVSLFLAACHLPPPNAPYTSEMPLGPWTGDWFGDGAPKVLAIANPLDFNVHVEIICPSTNDEQTDGFDHWGVDVNAKSEVRVLVETLNKDLFTNVCRVFNWEKIDRPARPPLGHTAPWTIAGRLRFRVVEIWRLK